MENSKTAKASGRIKVCFVLIAIVNCLTVVGLFLAGYGTQALPPAIASFMLSEMFLYILNILLALTIVLCVLGFAFTVKNFGNASTSNDKQVKSKKKHKEKPAKETANRAQVSKSKNEEVANSTEEKKVTEMQFAEDELNDENQSINSAQESIPANETEPAADLKNEPNDTDEIPEEEMIETVLQVVAEQNAGNRTKEPKEIVPQKPQLQKIEEVIQHALISSGIPTSLWGIEEDKEGAECMMYNPEEDSWYLYTIKNGQTENFEFFMNSEAHKAGKRFLERVRNRMTESI